MTLSIAPRPSTVNTPANTEHYVLILDFMADRFPKVPRDIWATRMNAGKVTDITGTPLPVSSPYIPDLKILYYREVTNELSVPFQEEILFRNDHIIIVDKPHFLPTIPSGPYVTECLLYRLRNKLGNEEIVPVNRIDRETAGLVMLSTEPTTRSHYSSLFSRRRVQKTYLAVSEIKPFPAADKQWLVETRIETSSPWFLNHNVDGPPNSSTRITALESQDTGTLFQLEPITGKKHQLRVHMCHIGFPILNDPFYPELSPKKEGFDKPLQLLARDLAFTDPLTREDIHVTSRLTLGNPNVEDHRHEKPCDFSNGTELTPHQFSQP